MNLKTAVLTPDRTFKVSDGWYVMRSEESVFPILLNSIPLHEADLSAAKNPSYLLSGSLSTKIVECTLPPSEDDFFAKEETIYRKHVTLSPRSDDLFYYRFFLGKDDKISFSSDFTVILDDWAEENYHADHYVRIVYASLPLDAPLTIDSNNKICISPI